MLLLRAVIWRLVMCQASRRAGRSKRLISRAITGVGMIEGVILKGDLLLLFLESGTICRFNAR